MGNYFRTVPKGKLEESLITFLKTRKLQHINDVNINSQNRVLN